MVSSQSRKKNWPLATCPKCSRSCVLKILGRAIFKRLNYVSRLEVGKIGERRDDEQHPKKGYSRPFSTYLGSSDASLALLFISLFISIVAYVHDVLPISKWWPQLGRGVPCSHFFNVAQNDDFPLCENTRVTFFFDVPPSLVFSQSGKSSFCATLKK